MGDFGHKNTLLPGPGTPGRNAGVIKKMPSFDLVVPVLKVTHLQRALEFYMGMLGFNIVWQAANDGGGDNAMLANGPVSLLLSTGEHLGKQPQFSGSLYFNMTGIDGFFEAIKDQVEIVWPIETMDFGQREFGIRDPDGYTLAFAEAVPPASPTG